MTLQSFKYAPADSLQTAEALLREHGERAVVLAGGTDLLGALKDAIHDDPPELLIGLKPVTALRYVEAEPSGVGVGRAVGDEREGRPSQALHLERLLVAEAVLPERLHHRQPEGQVARPPSVLAPAEGVHAPHELRIEADPRVEREEPAVDPAE